MVPRFLQSNTKWRLGLVTASTNPEGIEAFSPALRGTSYAGLRRPRFPYPERVVSEVMSTRYSTPSGLTNLNAVTQGRPSRSRANPGLNDAILTGLPDLPLELIQEELFLFHRKHRRPATILTTH